MDDGSCMELAVHTALTSVRCFGPPYVDNAFLDLVLGRRALRERASNGAGRTRPRRRASAPATAQAEL